MDTTEEYSILSLFHINVRMAGCYRYMKTIPNVTSPIVRCKNLVMSIKDCVDNYEAQGKSTEEALRLCDTEAVQKAIEVRYNPEMLKQMFPSDIPESTRERIEAYIDNNPVMGDFLANLDDNQRRIYMRLTRAQQKELLQEGIENARARLSRMRLVTINRIQRFKLRVIDAARLRRIREILQRRRRIYLSLLQNFSAARSEFMSLKDSEQAACAEDNESVECLEAINATIEFAKEMLTNLADLQIEGLEIVAGKIESSEYLSEETAETALLEINETIQNLEEAKTLLEEAVTKEEVKAAGEVIVLTWRTIKQKIAKHNRMLKRAALRIIIRRAKAFEFKVEQALSRLSESRRARVEALLEQFSEKIKDAEETVESEDFDEEDVGEILDEVGDAQGILEDIGDESVEGEVTVEDEVEDDYEVIEETDDE
jgi:hypothetical protein